MVFLPSNARPAYALAFIQRILGRSQQAADSCRVALQTEDYSIAHLRAHRMLSQLELPGEDYFRVMGRIHQHLKHVGVGDHRLLQPLQLRRRCVRMLGVEGRQGALGLGPADRNIQSSIEFVHGILISGSCTVQ